MGKQFWKPGNMLYPVPAVMVSCQNGEEKPNIITVAWTSTSCSSPAMVSISIRPERYSHRIIKESGEFVVNLVSEELVYASDFCGVRSGRDMDKFETMKLTPSPSRTVKAPGIAESPVNIECKVVQIIPLGSHDLFLGEVTGVTVDDRYLDENGKLHLDAAGLTVYSHGAYYGLGDRIGTFGYSVAKKKTGKADLPDTEKRKSHGKGRSVSETKAKRVPVSLKKSESKGTTASKKKVDIGSVSASGKKAGSQKITASKDNSGSGKFRPDRKNKGKSVSHKKQI